MSNSLLGSSTKAETTSDSLGADAIPRRPESSSTKTSPDDTVLARSGHFRRSCGDSSGDLGESDYIIRDDMSEIEPSDANLSPTGVYVIHDAEDLASIRRCRAGDPTAFEPIVLRYQRVLFTVALRMLGDRDDADDAAQNAFVKAYEKLATFDEKRRFFSWIYRILVNECINLRRDRHVHEELANDIAEQHGTPADVFEHRETSARVQAAILALPMPYREVIVLRHFADLPYDEIAGTLGVSASVVKSRLFTARQRLAQMLFKTGQDV
jgi:RNA polymerase sigma-70 factor (ECF subfamily)